jgi:3-deoxy-D-manno-octulosonate 8-phosphate phosphatase (KDO 8-P phosphatase)
MTMSDDMSPDAIARARGIKLAVFDVDGVMTSGALFLGDDGQEYKAFNSLDGHGLKMLRGSGVALAIITGRRSNVVEHRSRNLGIAHVFQGVENKLEAYRHLLELTGVNPEAVAYMGDDLVDLPVMTRAGFAVTVPSAPDDVKRHAHWVTPRAGGAGAVRDLCEFILRAQGAWDKLLASYLA